MSAPLAAPKCTQQFPYPDHCAAQELSGFLHLYRLHLLGHKKIAGEAGGKASNLGWQVEDGCPTPAATDR